MPETYQVIDLFAGPGGLAEGFANVRAGDRRPFEIALSVEKDVAAHSTLRLRAFLRQFGDDLPKEYLEFLEGGRDQPDWAALYPGEWAAAEAHALLLELGTPEAAEALAPRLAALAGQDTIVIGGPPCQAYSIAGRVRNRGTDGYEARDDTRHFLYREYIRILAAVRPVAFIMENVKGLLTSRVDGVRILDLVLADLRSAGGDPDSYRLLALAPGRSTLFGQERAAGEDFLIRAEEHGVPQARHRMIIVGIRADHADLLDPAGPGWLMWPAEDRVTLEQVLSGLPDLRSGLSGSGDFQEWRDAMVEAMDLVIDAIGRSTVAEVSTLSGEAMGLRDRFWMRCPVLPRSSCGAAALPEACPADLRDWLSGSAGGRISNHATRSHMSSDLARYFFAAVFASVHGRSPKAVMFPDELAPEHRNWKSGKFTDRFRVQVRGRPSTTITSHISKDGHYFIHPDPLQCRALTVREAARLQTFPDDYMFLGNRTSQYVQVGNAVPPYLARRIGEALHRMLTGADAASDAGAEPARANASSAN